MNSEPEWMDAMANQLCDQRLAVMDHFLTDELTTELRESLHKEYQHGIFHKAEVGRKKEQQEREDIRGDYILWLDECRHLPCIQEYEGKIAELMAFFNRSLYLGLHDSEVHFALYPIGAFYKRHLDRFKTNGRRSLSIITYLNENWKEEQGGQLMIYQKTEEGNEETTRISPQGGRMVCFDSGQKEHEVLPASRERCSVTGWLLR